MKLLKSRHLALAVAAAFAAVATVGIACSNSSGTTPPVTVFDGAVSPDTGSPPVTGDDAGPPVTDSSSPQPDVVIIDASLPDVGPCVSDAAVMYDAQVCNSCYTPAQDPLNACSAYHCTPFDNSRVPTGAP